jgi:hypothetical protein
MLLLLLLLLLLLAALAWPRRLLRSTSNHGLRPGSAPGTTSACRSESRIHSRSFAVTAAPGPAEAAALVEVANGRRLAPKACAHLIAKQNKTHTRNLT